MGSVNRFPRIANAAKRRDRVRALGTVLTPVQSRGCYGKKRFIRRKEKYIAVVARAT